jgi:FHS family L-fucose permease-like MFS transporter
MKNNHSNLPALLSVLFGFYIMGFCDIVGVSVSYAKEQFQWSETQSGFLPSMVFIWFLIISIPTIGLMNRFGRKKTVMMSSIVTFAGMILPLISFTEVTCLVAFSLLGIGNTILQVSLNPLLTDVVKGGNLSSTLTAGQFIKAISSFLGPIIAGVCSSFFGNWQYIFPVFAFLTLVSTLWLLMTKIKEESNTINAAGIYETFGLLKHKPILILFFGIFCVVGLDIGMNILTPKLLMERVGMAKEAAGYGTSWYFVFRMAGTLLGAFLLSRIKEIKYFRISVFICLFSLFVLLYMKTYTGIVFFVCIVALGGSSIFSIIISLALKVLPRKTNEISGLMITGIAGGAVIAPLMGFSADVIGHQSGSILIIILCVLYLIYASFNKTYVIVNK